MKNIVITYGLTAEKVSLLSSVLPEGYGLETTECVTDLIVGNPVCTVIDTINMSEDSLRVLLAYYMDVGDRLDETVVWLGNAALPELPSFICCDSFLDLLPQLENIISKAQARYDAMQMYISEYAYLPKHAVEESIEADINTALHRKYGINPDPLIVERVRRELTALREVDALQDLAAVYELSRWLKAQNIPFYVRHGTASGFIPYILGITHTNPLPPHTSCPECKELHWNHDYKDGFDIPEAICPNCGTALIRDGHNLVWPQFCGYGTPPTYVFWLPPTAQDQLSSWVANHWMKQNWETVWEPIQERKGRILAGPCGMHFGLMEDKIDPEFHNRIVTADQTEELIRLVGLRWQEFDGIGMPYPKNASEALSVYELLDDSGLRNKYAKYLLHCGLGISDLICCREDIFYYLCDHGFTEKDAIRGMNNVRNEKGFPVITGEMRNARDKWVLTQCAHVEHLPSKSEDWEWLFFQIRCGWAPPAYSGLSTGIDVLDNSILCIQPGEVILVGGRPAMGKTSLAKGVAEYVAKKKNVLFYDLEESGCDHHPNIHGVTGCFSIEQIIHTMVKEKPDLLIIDRFQRIPEIMENGCHKTIMGIIKRHAKKYQISVLITTDLSRDIEERPSPVPCKTDIPAHSVILPLVDTVLLLYRTAYYDPILDRSAARFIIPKAKRCKYKILTPKWDDENHRFTD